jgi:hypothetical protein
MGTLTRQAILAASDLTSEEVAVPEWGGTVTVRTLTGTERNAFAASLVGPDGKVDARRYNHRLVAASMVDETGAPLFALDEVDMLAAKSGPALERVFAVAERLNGASQQAVEAAEKNSSAAPIGG